MSYPPPPGGPPPHKPGDPTPPEGQPGRWDAPPHQPQWPQQAWHAGPPPKKRGNGWKWVLGALALLVVIGVTVAVTISVTSSDGGSGDPGAAGGTYGLASADDTGPVNIITEDPSCAAWIQINTTLADAQRNGWGAIDRTLGASDWTPAQRAQHDAVGHAMTDAATRTERLLKITPHRAMRELYEQFVAYARAYSESIPSYEPVDSYLATVVADTSSAVANICATISYGSAAAWAPLVPDVEPPAKIAPLAESAEPIRFLSSRDSTCPDWEPLLRAFQEDTAPWKRIDAAKPASEWDSDQQLIAADLAPVISRFADEVERLGREADNAVIQDFAVLAAQYRRAFVEALPTYTAADSYLSAVAVDLTNTIFDACKAVET